METGRDVISLRRTLSFISTPSSVRGRRSGRMTKARTFGVSFFFLLSLYAFLKNTVGHGMKEWWEKPKSMRVRAVSNEICWCACSSSDLWSPKSDVLVLLASDAGKFIIAINYCRRSCGYLFREKSTNFSRLWLLKIFLFRVRKNVKCQIKKAQQ